MDAAQDLVMQQGFAGTSVDAVLGRASATKGAFFHHFPTKEALGRALVERYARDDADLLERTAARAEAEGRDPVGRLVLFVRLLEEADGGADPGDPGCLFATFLYERQLVDPDTRRLIAESMHLWRERVAAMIRAAAEARAPRRPVDPDALADQLLTVVEGAFVMARALDDDTAVARQLALYREHLELLFTD